MRLGPERTRVLWSLHHISADGGAAIAVFHEIFAAYDAPPTDPPSDPLPPGPRFEEYLDWLAGRDHAGALEFWRAHVAGIRVPTRLALDRSAATWNAADDEDTERSQRFARLTRSSSDGLRAWARRHDLTLNTLLCGAWAWLLSVYSGQRRVCFGTLRGCRRGGLPGAERLIGLLANTLPAVASVDPDQPLVAFLSGLRRDWLAARPHEHTPLPRIVEASDLRRGRTLFESLVIYHSASHPALLASFGGDWSRRQFSLEHVTRFPLTVDAYGDEALGLRLTHDASRIDDEAAGRLLSHLVEVLEAMADQFVNDHGG